MKPIKPIKKGYWPESVKPLSSNQWQDTIEGITADHGEMIALIRDPQNDLFAPFPWGNGQILFRKAIILAGHNSYHIGQLNSHPAAVGGPGAQLVGFYFLLD